MGSWGLGPFASDHALDVLGDIADRYASVDDDGQIVPGSVQPGVREELSALLAAAHEGEHQALSAYAVLGLLAAAGVHGTGAGSRGTSLFGPAADDETDDPMDLAAHCGFVRLLERPGDLEAITANARECWAVIAGSVPEQYAGMVAQVADAAGVSGEPDSTRLGHVRLACSGQGQTPWTLDAVDEHGAQAGPTHHFPSAELAIAAMPGFLARLREEFSLVFETA